MTGTIAERSEKRHLKRLTKAGYHCSGAGLRSIVSVAILVPEEKLEEARLLFKCAAEMASWRMPEVWRKRFYEAGITIPGQRAKVWMVVGSPK